MSDRLSKKLTIDIALLWRSTGSSPFLYDIDGVRLEQIHERRPTVALESKRARDKVRGGAGGAPPLAWRKLRGTIFQLQFSSAR